MCRNETTAVVKYRGITKDNMRLCVRKVRWNGVNIIHLPRIWPSGGLWRHGNATAGSMNCKKLHS